MRGSKIRREGRNVEVQAIILLQEAFYVKGEDVGGLP